MIFTLEEHEATHFVNMIIETSKGYRFRAMLGRFRLWRFSETNSVRLHTMDNVFDGLSWPSVLATHTTEINHYGVGLNK